MGGRGIASGRRNFGNRTASAPQAAACPTQESSLPQTVSYGTNNRITGGAYQYDASGDIDGKPGTDGTFPRWTPSVRNPTSPFRGDARIAPGASPGKGRTSPWRAPLPSALPQALPRASSSPASRAP